MVADMPGAKRVFTRVQDNILDNIGKRNKGVAFIC